MFIRKISRIFSKSLLSFLLWSIISAAFIGPGTVTTATTAGAGYGFALLWPLTFSTIACILLQEASARIRIVSGLELGQAISRRFSDASARVIILILIVGAIIVGCAAYQTGNILGAMEGLILLIQPDDFAQTGGVVSFLSEHFKKITVIVMGILAFIFLNLRSLDTISRIMGVVVLFMAGSFFFVAVALKPDISSILQGSFIPSMPDGSGLLILGLVGTTVVPYDLFLGSGVLEKKQTLTEMRVGISLAIGLGGIISMAILVVGTVVVGEYSSFDVLASALKSRFGIFTVYLFGFGMFAAGFSSAITAPLASAITARSLFGERNPEKWKNKSIYFKTVWGSVLLIGLCFGLAEIKPIPAIILAQALNGLILPFISIFLLFVVNDPKLMGDKVNGWFSNILLCIVVWVTLVLGLIKVTEQLSEAWEFAIQKGITSFVVISILAFLATFLMMLKIYYDRQRKPTMQSFIDDNKVVHSEKKN